MEITTSSSDTGAPTAAVAGTPSGGTAGVQSGAATVATTPTPQAATPSAVFFPENWREGLGELKEDPGISKYTSIPELAKAHVSLQKLVGRDKISLPDKHGTAEDWKGVFQKLGLPEKADMYEVETPKDAFNPEFLKSFKSAAFENNILPKQAEKLLGWYADLQKNQQAQAQQNMDTQAIQAKETLKKEWGEAFDTKKTKAESAAKRFFNNEGVDFLERTGLTNNVHFAKAFAAIGELLQEHGIKGNPSTYTGLTPGDAGQKIEEIMGNKTHPYWNKDHANHKAAVEEVSMLYRARHPES